MFSRMHNRKGFTLIELMIVVVIIGILAALAIPRFMAATVKAKEAECKSVLKQIYTLQRAYKQGSLTSTYCDALDDVDFSFDTPPNAKYTYAMGAVSTTAFCASATGNSIDADIDADNVWHIDETGVIARGDCS